MESAISAGTVTRLLQRWRTGERAAFDELLPLVYEELHQLAALHMRRERSAHTLTPTALISMVYERLSIGAPPEWNDRVHFFAIAACSMRQVLVDHARKHMAAKRGGGEGSIPLTDSVASLDRPDAIVAINRALTSLATVDERKARVVEMVYFGGMPHDEVATALGIHVNTVARDLRFSEAWIRRHLLDE